MFCILRERNQDLIKKISKRGDKTKKGNSTYVSVLDRLEIREIKAKKNSEAERKLDKLFLKMLIVLDCFGRGKSSRIYG